MHCIVYVINGANPGTDFLFEKTQEIFEKVRYLSKQTGNILYFLEEIYKIWEILVYKCS